MIYVTASGVPLAFRRLIEKMDKIAADLEEEVIIQGGYDYAAKNATYHKYFPRRQADKHIQNARLIVSHAGIGTIINALQYRKPIIIIPRLKKYNEHFNDHQLEIAEALRERKGIKVIYDVEELEDSLSFSERPDIGAGRKRLINTIKSYVENISG